jgi:hypothetical protein
MPDKFDPEGSGYDYDTAIKGGAKSEPVPGDDRPHWPTRDPETGQILKGRQHPTWGLGMQGEEQEGYDVYKGMGGKYYSTPHFARGGPVLNAKSYAKRRK